MSKLININEVLNNFKPIFDKYKELMYFPVFAWGRYYKYELRGEPFEIGPEDFAERCLNITNGPKLDWKLINEILENKIIENISIPERKDWVYDYNDEDRGGTIAIIKKSEDNTLELKFYRCDSPE